MIIFFIVSFLASVIGAICGIGGGMVGRALNKKWIIAPLISCSSDLWWLSCSFAHITYGNTLIKYPIR